MNFKFIKTAVVTIGICLTIIGVSSSNALAVECPEATLVRISVLDSASVPSAAASQYMLRVTCNTSFTDERYYYLSADLGDPAYATVLTALSLNKTIRMFMTGYYKGAIITEMQLNI